jgi:hypothetical protein
VGKHGPFRSRLCLVTDIESYSTRTTPQQGDGQRRLLRITQFALARAQIFRVAQKWRQDRGDGQMLLMPPRLDQTRAIPALVTGLRHALYLNNADPGPFGRMRMRAAFVQGTAAQGATGFEGRAPIVAGRLVDSQQLKQDFKNRQAADLALIVPDDLYQDVIKQDFPGLPPGEFTPMQVSHKEYTGTAWIYLPTSGSAADPNEAANLWGAVETTIVVAGLVSGGGALAVATASRMFPPSCLPGDLPSSNADISMDDNEADDVSSDPFGPESDEFLDPGNVGPDSHENDGAIAGDDSDSDIQDLDSDDGSLDADL